MICEKGSQEDKATPTVIQKAAYPTIFKIISAGVGIVSFSNGDVFISSS